MKREDLHLLGRELNDLTNRIEDALQELGLSQDTEELGNFEVAVDRLVMELYELSTED